MNPGFMVPLIVASLQQQYTTALKKAEATSPSRARSLAELGCKPSKTLDELVRKGLIVESEPGRYYLNLAQAESEAERARIGALIAMVALAGIFVLALLLSRIF